MTTSAFELALAFLVTYALYTAYLVPFGFHALTMIEGAGLFVMSLLIRGTFRRGEG